MTKREKNILILITIFYLVILFLSPISGDDWGNAINKRGIIDSIVNAFRLYFTWEGRITSRIFINLLTPNKIIWNIVNSISIGFFLYLTMKIIKPKNKVMFYLTLLIIPLMNLLTFSETITFIAGNLTYFIEIPFILLYYYLIFNKKHNDNKVLVLLSILSILICMTVEHMGATLIVGNLVLLLYIYFRDKKIDKKLIFVTLLCFVSTLLMYLSPGSQYRMSIENVEFNKLNIFQKINFNIPSFIYYTFVVNYYLLILWIISNYFIIKDKIKNNYFKIILILFMSIIPLMTILIYLKSIVHKEMFINNFYLNIYYIMFAVVSFILNLKEKNFKSTFLFIIGICANGVMMLSPTWGYRTSLFTYITLSLSNLMIISKYVKDSKLFEYLLKVVLILMMISYLFIYVNVFRCQIDNKKYIRQQLNDNKEIIEILKNPYFVNCNINPNTDYHKMVYKKYYNIAEDKDLIQIDKWKYLIIYKN